MKLISFAVPCYNSGEYMHRCIDTLLTGGSEVEIIIINDGSKDGTLDIARQYENDHAGIVRVIDQENKGHGGAVNAGLAAATGRYFKVVDSDDWVNTDSLAEIILQIRKWEQAACPPDMIVCNYIYDHLHENKQKRIAFRNIFKSGRMSTWDDMGRFSPAQYMIMHALIFTTEILRKSGVELPLHTFYVDNIIAYKPLPFVKSICYLDLDFYHYFIGRSDQSVNESVMCKRIDQQIFVTKMIVSCADLEKIESARLRSYMIRSISIMMTVSSVHLHLINNDEARQKHHEMWDYVKRTNLQLYRCLRRTTLSSFAYYPKGMGKAVFIGGYRFAKKVYKFQ